MQRLDDWLLGRLNSLAGRSAGLDRLATGLARFSSVAEILLALSLPLVAGWRGLVALVRVGQSLILANGVVRLVQTLAPRPRPYLRQPVRQLVERRPSPSFPSRHVASAVAMAVPAWQGHRGVGGAMLVVAALLGLSRVFSGLHYPSDVLAGAVVGLGCARLVARRR